MRPLFPSLLLALSGTAWSAPDCSIEIHGTDQMTYDKTEIVVPKACSCFTVTLVHPGTMPREVMGHNWVLSLASDVQAITTDGNNAGLEHDYLQPKDPRVIASTQLIGGGEQDSVTFDITRLSAGKDYRFFCSFPFHATLMKGSLTLGK